jgi:hypothetical protein
LGVQIAKLKSKVYIEKGAQMQGANYSLNQGFNYKTFKTAWIKTKKWPNDVVLKMLFIFFSFKPVTVSAVMEGGTLQQ